MIQRTKPATKFTAIFTLICFLLQSVYFYVQPTFAENTSSNNLAHVEFSPDKAQILKQHDAGSDKWVICIQDYHANPDVQLSVADIIESICEQTAKDDFKFTKKGNNNRILVAIEGHSGNYVTSEIREMKEIDQSLKQLLTDYFLLQGRLDGAEYLDITKKCPITLYGIEDKPLYEKKPFLLFKLHRFKTVRNGRILSFEKLHRAKYR